jgi:AraC-like DNA-binding protein
MHRAHIRDLDEAVHLVGQVYDPHQLSLHRRAASIDVSLDVAGAKTWPIVRLRYGASVRVDTDFRNLMVIKRCVEGTGSVRQGGKHAQWRPGSIIPLSPNRSTVLDFGQDFASTSLKLDTRRLELLCSRWLGHPLDEEIRFALTPFSDTLLRTWNSTLAVLESGGFGVNALPQAAEAALEEFVLTLLLRGHPHNFSEELERPERDPGSRLVRRAVQFIEERASSALTTSDIAAGIGASVRALQAGFRNWRQVTPTEYLRTIRLQRVRDALLQANPSTTVTDVALDHGFLHLGRFSQHYKRAFGENPVATLARTRRCFRPRSLNSHDHACRAVAAQRERRAEKP